MWHAARDTPVQTRLDTTRVAGGETAVESRVSTYANQRRLMDDIHAVQLARPNPYDLCVPPKALSVRIAALCVLLTLKHQPSPPRSSSEPRRPRRQSESQEHQHGQPQGHAQGRVGQVRSCLQRSLVGSRVEWQHAHALTLS